YGGGGNDTLQGGLGPNILVGGDGDDTLTGSGARGGIVGGLGQDTLQGGGDADPVLSGDFLRGRALSGLRPAGDGVQSRWLALTAYADRVAAVRDYVLTRASDDTSADVLYGGGGSNLYFADLSGAVRDQLADRGLGEIAIDLAGH